LILNDRGSARSLSHQFVKNPFRKMKNSPITPRKMSFEFSLNDALFNSPLIGLARLAIKN